MTREPIKQIDVVAAVIRRGDRVLIARRAPGEHLAGKWEFQANAADWRPYQLDDLIIAPDTGIPEEVTTVPVKLALSSSSSPAR